MYSFQGKQETNKKQVQEQPVNVHMVPFKIESDGPAKVKEYFESIMQEKKNQQTGELDHYKTSLYGREILGNQINLPEGVQAHFFKRNASDFESIKFNEINKCNLYQWQHDEKPQISDKFQSNAVYLKIMQELSQE